MALIQNFTASTSSPNQIALSWLQPLGFNDTDDEIIITRTTDHFPMELYNSAFPNTATDSIPITIFSGSTIVGINTGAISVIGNVLTDTSASFPNGLNNRLLRDSQSQVFTIISNTSTSVTLSGNPSNGIYVILCDYPTETQTQLNFINSDLTTSGPGTISNLVSIINGSNQVNTFSQDQLVNLIFIDASGNLFIIKDNNQSTLNFFGNSIPAIGEGMMVLPSFNNSSPVYFIDNYLDITEVTNKQGTGLLNNTFYYYTGFTIPEGVNVAQAEFGLYESGQSTQTAGISTQNRNLGNLMYSYFPNFIQQLDTTEDLYYLMQVMGFQFTELYSLINSFNIQDADTVYVNALLPLSEQLGLPTVGFSIGIDTLRRIARNLISAWQLKGSKQGIAEFIRIITTWDVTGGTGDFSSSIIDSLVNSSALRFYLDTLGNLNTKITQTNPVVFGGKFYKSLPGVIIPGFFTFREYVVNLPNVAMYVGTSVLLTTSSNTTVLFDNTANFGSDNSLIGNYLLANEQEVNGLYQIISNTSNTITVSGIVQDLTPGGTYVVLSPLNTKRFIILNQLLPLYQPFGTAAGFNFIAPS